MRRRPLTVLMLAGLFLLAGCERERPGDRLAATAAALDAELARIRAAAVELADAATVRFEDPSRDPGPRFPGRTYRTFEGALTFYQGGPDELSSLLIQETPASPASLARLLLLEHLDGRMRETVAASPLVAMAWVATADSAAVFFPSYDLVAYVPVDLDVPRDILPYRAAAPAANPGRVPVWVEPYVDITGKGYMVTVSAPVYRGTEMVAVAAADVSVARLAARFVEGGDAELRLLLTASGFLAGTTEGASRAMGIEALGRFYYLEQVERDAPAPERFNLTRYPNPAVQELASRVLAGEAAFPLRTADRGYRVVAVPVPVAGWYLVELEVQP